MNWVIFFHSNPNFLKSYCTLEREKECERWKSSNSHQRKRVRRKEKETCYKISFLLENLVSGLDDWILVVSSILDVVMLQRINVYEIKVLNNLESLKLNCKPTNYARTYKDWYSLIMVLIPMNSELMVGCWLLFWYLWISKVFACSSSKDNCVCLKIWWNSRILKLEDDEQ